MSEWSNQRVRYHYHCIHLHTEVPMSFDNINQIEFSMIKTRLFAATSSLL